MAGIQPRGRQPNRRPASGTSNTRHSPDRRAMQQTRRVGPPHAPQLSPLQGQTAREGPAPDQGSCPENRLWKKSGGRSRAASRPETDTVSRDAGAEEGKDAPDTEAAGTVPGCSIGRDWARERNHGRMYRKQGSHLVSGKGCAAMRTAPGGETKRWSARFTDVVPVQGRTSRAARSSFRGGPKTIPAWGQ